MAEVRFERRYKGYDDWEPVSRYHMLNIFKHTFKDVTLEMERLLKGETITTMFAQYRMAPEDKEPTVRDLIVYFEEQGDEATAKALREYLAQGKIRNVDRYGKEA